MRTLAIAFFAALIAPALALAQPVTQTGAVQTVGGINLQLQPTTLYVASCNGGLGGIVTLIGKALGWSFDVGGD